MQQKKIYVKIQKRVCDLTHLEIINTNIHLFTDIHEDK